MKTVIENLLDPIEVHRLLREADRIGWEVATIFDNDGNPIVRKDYRNNDRVILDSPVWADLIWGRLWDDHQSALITNDAEWEPVGLNERIRVYRYQPGQNFAMHQDHPFVRNEDERSFQTVLIGLSDRYDGGETAFQDESIKLTTGLGVVFMHFLMHEGMPVTEGTKYALRSDIMYRRKESK